MAVLVDWLVAKTPIPAVIGMTLFVYVTLVLYLAWDGSAKYIFGLGLISAIPAAVCSWLSSDRQTREPNSAGTRDQIKTRSIFVTREGLIAIRMDSLVGWFARVPAHSVGLEDFAGDLLY